MPRALAPIFFPSIGGLGFDPDEKLLRFIGAFEEAAAFAEGRLSLTRVGCFKDFQEGQRTDADYAWMREFFGANHHSAITKIENRRHRMRHEAFVSCWHRFSATSDLQRIESEYVGNKDFCCVALSSVRSVLNSGFHPGGPFCSLDFFPVIYIEDESEKLETHIEDQYPICGYPELMFKRAPYKFEQEARFVLHDHSATLLTAPPHGSPFVQDTNWEYVAINSLVFLTAFVALNDYTFGRLQQLETLVPITQVSSDQLQAFII